MMIRVVLLSVALMVGACAVADAEFDPITARMTERPQLVEYRVAGRTVEARLVTYTTIPPSAKSVAEARQEHEGVVFLRDYLWFPNPLSSPEVFVAVTDTSSFVLEMFSEIDRPFEEFEFQDIVPGVYAFALAKPHLPVRPCVVRLLLDGEPAGQLPTRTHCSSYHW